MVIKKKESLHLTLQSLRNNDASADVDTNVEVDELK